MLTYLGSWPCYAGRTPDSSLNVHTLAPALFVPIPLFQHIGLRTFLCLDHTEYREHSQHPSGGNEVLARLKKGTQ